MASDTGRAVWRATRRRISRRPRAGASSAALHVAYMHIYVYNTTNVDINYNDNNNHAYIQCNAAVMIRNPEYHGTDLSRVSYLACSEIQHRGLMLSDDAVCDILKHMSVCAASRYTLIKHTVLILC